MKTKRNPPGSKLARRIACRKQQDWKGEIVHTGELTQLNAERAAKRVLFPSGLEVV